MGNFRQDSRGGGFDRGNRSGGNRFGGRDRFDNNRGFERRAPQMHDATCSKCGKACQVPFRPTGSKPVFCNDCFRSDGAGSESNPRSHDRPAQSGISQDQFTQLNTKLDRIIRVLQELEIDTTEEEGEVPAEESEEDAEEDAE